ncbi:MAG: tetratricopeptide repeat protein, partial [Chthonomonadales bacterium]|nr:tetratricopeptide repeat protein [Chthonomonadales bacterium]
MTDIGAPVWRVRMLGPLQLSGDFGVIDRFPTRKAASLVGYLAYHSERAHSRDRLADLLWPDAPGDLARQSLRTALWSVRRQIEPRRELAGAVLHTDRDSVGIRPGAIETDIGAFWSALRNASEGRMPGETHWLGRAVSLYADEFLAGLDDPWVTPERERLDSACSGALLRGAHLCEETGAIEEALEWALRAVAHDPLSEEGHVTIVRLHLAAGRRSEAARHAREAGRLWRDELGLEPSSAVNRLLEQAATAHAPSRATVVAARSGTDPSAGFCDVPLPYPLTAMFGRESEQERTVSLLRPGGDTSTRLVTITGVGGCGKTRLAVAVARELGEAYGAAPPLAPLETARTASDLVSAISAAIRLSAAPQVQPLDAVVQRLRGRRSGRDGRVLLVLDGFDDPSDEARDTLSEGLLGRVPGLVCLVTSRRTLGILGEHVVRLGPLPVPAPTDPTAVAREHAVVKMLFDRLRARRPDLTLDDPTVGRLVQLAAIVDGLPLGVELLAGWADVMDPEEMLRRLRDPLAITARPGNATADRHYSLDRVFEWSWGSLDPASRAALVRLAGFRCDWNLDAAEAVCGPGSLELVRELMDRSLLIAVPSFGTGRYRMLTPVRAFVRKHAERGDTEAADRQAASYYAHMAWAAGERLDGPDGEVVAAALGPELENITRALELCFGELATDALRGDGVRAAASIWPLWERSGRFGEGRDVLRKAVARAPGPSSRDQARALLGLGMLAGVMGDYAESRDNLERSLTMTRACGDREGESAALVGLASRAWDLGDIRGAAELYRMAHDLAGTASHVWSAIGLAKIAAHEDRFDDARALQQQALAEARAVGSRRHVADILQEIGVTEWFAGHPELSRPPLIESLAIHRRLGDRYSQLRSLWCLGKIALDAGRIETARGYYLDATDIAVWGGHPVRVAYCLEAFAGLAVAAGAPDRAGRLFGAAQALRDNIGYSLRLPAEIRLRDHLVRTMHDSLGPEAYENV